MPTKSLENFEAESVDMWRPWGTSSIITRYFWKAARDVETHALHIAITDSAGHILYSKEDATKGKFAFTTEDYDMFEVCFESKGTGRIPDQLVILDMKHGVEAKNYEEENILKWKKIGSDWVILQQEVAQLQLFLVRIHKSSFDFDIPKTQLPWMEQQLKTSQNFCFSECSQERRTLTISFVQFNQLFRRKEQQKKAVLQLPVTLLTVANILQMQENVHLVRENIAKVEKLKPLEVELRRLEDLSESIVNDFAYMKKREEEMRDTNESTNTRVLYFSIFSMFCLIGLATWQVFYLRRFFKAKKLIE
ncbi:hypothetical protein P7K49_018334 [Saguinus oedipus]|uniref:GOLD domain-containing protein n=1 Tax=Saguinus oedipus TaxID=9490 RepID=A0ABQ9V533_SAGOE|nr:hypothetical protein P7K49_018334 [Saguinus oedipus]